MKSFLSLLIALLLPLSAASAEESVSFRSDIAPILLERCLACHGPQKAEGGYRVDSFAQATSEGDSFMPGFVPEDIESSEALRRITSDDPAERMPLEGEKLPATEIAKIQRWVEEGARFDGENPAAPLASIVPPPQHPDPPSEYRHPLPITALCFDASGNRLFASGYHEVTVWNSATGELVQRIRNAPQRVYALALSPDGKLLAVAGGSPGRSGEVRLFAADSGELRQVLNATSDVVLDVAFDPAGERLAAAGADNIVRIFDAATFEQQRQLTSHSDWVMDIAWDASGKRLVSASRDKSVKVFDAENGDLLVTYAGHGAMVHGAVFHPDGKQVYSAGADKKLHRWTIQDGKQEADSTLGAELYKLELADGQLFVPAADGMTYQLDAAKHADVQSYGDPSSPVLAASYNSEQRLLATGTFHGQIEIRKPRDDGAVRSFIAAPGYNRTP